MDKRQQYKNELFSKRFNDQQIEMLMEMYDRHAKPSIVQAIETCFEVAARRKWERTYWAFDIHGTMVEPNYKKDDIPTKFYPGAMEVLQMISKRSDIGTILYTCSHPHEVVNYMKFFKENDINFDFIHDNTEVVTDGSYGYYDKKPYFNVLFEDKAGFDPMNDWIYVKEMLEKYPESHLKQKKHDSLSH